MVLYHTYFCKYFASVFGTFSYLQDYYHSLGPVVQPLTDTSCWNLQPRFCNCLLLPFILSRFALSWAMVAHACNASYLGDWDGENCGSGPAQANSLHDPSPKFPSTVDWRRGSAARVPVLDWSWGVSIFLVVSLPSSHLLLEYFNLIRNFISNHLLAFHLDLNFSSSCFRD
jgi:hypothetical protein